MFLRYSEYTQLGGTLEATAFSMYEMKAEYIIKSQAGGQTGKRIDKLKELPQAVKDCTFALVMFLSANSPYNKQISSESQSQGGASESYSYAVKTDEEISRQCDDIISQYFYGGGIGNLLYRGVCL